MNSNTIQIQLVVDDKGSVTVKQFGQTMEKTLDDSSKAVERHAQKSSSALESLKRYWALYAAAIAAGAIYALERAIETASDLQETASKFSVVFEGQEAKATAWAQTLVESYAMSRREAMFYLASMQDLLVPMGMNAVAAGELSNEIVKLAADLGSFNNLPTEQVMGDIQSALVGNYETMKKYGVVLNAANVEQQALNMGLAKSADELDAGMKAQAAYELIVKGSAAAIGDMARTIEGEANQTKQLQANIENISGTIGNMFLPYSQRIKAELNEWLKAQEANIQANLPAYIQKVGDILIYAIEALRFFHNAWLGIKLVGTAAIQGIAILLDELFTRVRMVLTPLDLIFAGLVKIGALDVNPFDSIEQGLGQFRASSGDVTAQVMADIEKTNRGYDSAIATVQGWKAKIAEIPVTQAAASQQTIKTLQTQADAANQLTKAELKEREKAIKEQEKLRDKFSDEYQKMALGDYEYAVQKIEEQGKAYEEAGSDSVKVREWVASEIAKLAEAQKKDEVKAADDYAKESTKIYEQLRQDIRTGDLATYQSKLAILQEQYDAYKAHLEKLARDDQKYADGVQLLDAWMSNEKRKLWEEEVKEHGSTLEVMSVALQDHVDEDLNTSQTMYDGFKSILSGMKDDCKNILVAGMKGNWGEMKNYWDDLWGNMFDTFLNYLAQMIYQAALNPIALSITTSVSSALGLTSTASAATSTLTGSSGLDSLGTVGSLIKSIYGKASSLSAAPISSLVSGEYAALSGYIDTATYGGLMESAGVSLGGVGLAAGLGSLGYSKIGELLNLPQGGYSSIGSGAGAALAFILSGGNPLIAALGATGGGVIGSLFGGDDEPNKYGLNLEKHWNPSLSQGWTSGSGLSLIPETGDYLGTIEYATSHGNSWYDPIQEAMLSGMNDVTSAFNTSVQSALGEMSEKDAALVEAALAEYDFTGFEVEGRWDTENAEEAVTEGLTQYQEFLAAAYEEVLAQIEAMKEAKLEEIMAGIADGSVTLTDALRGLIDLGLTPAEQAEILMAEASAQLDAGMNMTLDNVNRYRESLDLANTTQLTFAEIETQLATVQSILATNTNLTADQTRQLSSQMKVLEAAANGDMTALKTLALAERELTEAQEIQYDMSMKAAQGMNALEIASSGLSDIVTTLATTTGLSGEEIQGLYALYRQTQSSMGELTTASERYNQLQTMLTQSVDEQGEATQFTSEQFAAMYDELQSLAAQLGIDTKEADAWADSLDTIAGSGDGVIDTIQTIQSLEIADKYFQIIGELVLPDLSVVNTTYSIGGGTDYSMAGGGYIGEHVLGIGLRSGRSYEFGEEGGEYVVPERSGSSGGEGRRGPDTIHVTVRVGNETLGTYVARISDDVRIEAIRQNAGTERVV